MAGAQASMTVFLIGVLLWVGGEPSGSAEAFQNKPTQAFHTFRARPWTRGHEGRFNYSRRLRKSIEQKKFGITSKAFKTSGGLGLALVRRDEKHSLVRAVHTSQNASKTTASKEGSWFAATFNSSLQRDAARVRAIDAVVTSNVGVKSFSRSSVSSTANGQPLKSQVFSGLEFGSGEYFTSLSFGSPPTEVLVTIDTGSDLVWLQCHPCENCYDQLDPIFNPELSDSYAAESCLSAACVALPRSSCNGFLCQYAETYGDGSFSKGELATETVTVNSTSGGRIEIPGIVFGCGHDNQGLFTASSGLLGLGRGRLSFPSQISQVVPPRFSYCLADRFEAAIDRAITVMEKEVGNHKNGSAVNPANIEHDRRTSAIPEKRAQGVDQGKSDQGKSDGDDYDDDDDLLPSSYLFFGEAEGFGIDLTYTDLIRNPSSPSFYYLSLTGISVAEEKLAIKPSVFELDVLSGRGGVILDTGTAITRLTSEAYVAMRDSFRVKAKHLRRVVVPEQQLFDTCFRLFEGQQVPVITMHFASDADLVLPLDNVVIPVDDSGSVHCLAFARSESRAEFTIIGNVQQQGFRFEFDLGKERVGFTRQDCDHDLS